MEGSALGSLKFSPVLGKLLGYAWFCSQDSPRSCGRGERWSLQVPAHGGISGEHCRPTARWSVLLHASFGTPLSTVAREGCTRRWPQMRHSGQGKGKSKLPFALPSAGTPCEAAWSLGDPTCGTGAVPQLPRSAGESFVSLVGRLNRALPRARALL